MTPHTEPTAQAGAAQAISWPDAARQAAFTHWLATISGPQALLPASVRSASADASFRRYFRVDRADGGSRIVMDAPPALEDCKPFVKVAGLMRQAGLQVPDILAWDEAQGFMLLSDVGQHTLMQVLQPDQPQANQALFLQAVDELVRWQLASQPGVLPPYDAALLKRELALFPDWYIARHRRFVPNAKQQGILDSALQLIVSRNLAAPSVYVHRDFMPRNLMVPTLVAARAALPPEGERPSLGRPGASAIIPTGEQTRLSILDFQDAVYGPITYDIASLMRDAFISWDEEFVLDITVRYWQRAQKAGLPVDADFGDFYRAVEWMGLQRHLKVAGIFARITLRDGKPKYLADAPRFIGYIRATCNRYRELGPLLQVIDEIEGLQAATGYAFGRV